MKEKNVLNVLRHCADNPGNGGAYRLPVMVAARFPKMNESEVYSALDYLHAKGYIALKREVLPPQGEGLSGYSAQILAEGYDYLMSAEKGLKLFRKEWRWNLASALITALVSALLGAGLARLSLLIWPP